MGTSNEREKLMVRAFAEKTSFVSALVVTPENKNDSFTPLEQHDLSYYMNMYELFTGVIQNAKFHYELCNEHQQVFSFIGANPILSVVRMQRLWDMLGIKTHVDMIALSQTMEFIHFVSSASNGDDIHVTFKCHTYLSDVKDTMSHHPAIDVFIHLYTDKFVFDDNS